MDKTKTFEEYVKMSIDSGVSPFELKFYPIVSVEENLPIAYRTKLTVNSIILGTLKEENYTYVSDTHQVSKELLKRYIIHIMKSYKMFLRYDRHIEFLSMRCPSEIVTRVNLYDLVKEVLDENTWFDPTKLCLEFEDSILATDFDKAKITMLDMKLLHVKTGIVGCGKEDFPLTKLKDITPDYVFLDSTTTTYAGSRNKPQLVPSLILFLKSMNIKTIPEGIDVYRKLLRNTDAVGFYNVNEKPLSLEDAAREREDLYVE